MVLARASAIVYCSNKTMEQVLHAFPFARSLPSRVIYPGCPPPLAPSLPDTYPTPYILCVSKWDIGRHPEFAIELAREIPVRVVLGGTWITQSARAEFLRKVADAADGLAGSIEIRDQLDEAQLDSTYARAWVYVHWNPEGFGMGALEAMARGVPVVCTDQAGVGELVKDFGNGRLIRGGETRDFVKAISEILADPELRMKLSEGAIETSRSVCWERHNEALATNLLSVIRRLA